MFDSQNRRIQICSMTLRSRTLSGMHCKPLIRISWLGIEKYSATGVSLWPAMDARWPLTGFRSSCPVSPTYAASHSLQVIRYMTDVVEQVTTWHTTMHNVAYHDAQCGTERRIWHTQQTTLPLEVHKSSSSELPAPRARMRFISMTTETHEHTGKSEYYISPQQTKAESRRHSLWKETKQNLPFTTLTHTHTHAHEENKNKLKKQNTK